jgi:hypothetical protein
MKKWFILVVSLFVLCGSAFAASKSKKKNEFKDPRDKQTYRTVKIAGLEWLGDNLNYKTAGSFCYKDEDDQCMVFGRLYT